MPKPFCFPGLFSVIALCYAAVASAQPIQHDAEHYVLLHQYAEQWAAEDEELEQRLADIRQQNSGKKTQYRLYPDR